MRPFLQAIRLSEGAFLSGFKVKRKRPPIWQAL